MTNTFIHFQDSKLEFINIYSYEDASLPEINSIKFSDIQNNLADSSNIFMMIPSQLFGFMKYENEKSYHGEVLKANVFMEIEDQLISDVSSLTFFYNSDFQLASWIESSLFEFIVKSLDGLDAEITMIPEHFLIHGLGDSIFIKDNSFILAFDNYSGFGGSLDILSDYLETTDAGSFNKNDFLLFADATSAADHFLEEKKTERRDLADLHHKLLQHKNLSTWNLFQRELSFSFLKAKFKLNSLESSFIVASVLTILIAPLMINAVLSSSISSYQSNTMEIFRQLNPSFKRMVNPKAQIDDLTRDIPSYSRVSLDDLEVLSYIETLSDESIQSININFEDLVIKANVDNLSPVKLSLFEELIKSQSGNVNTSGLSKSSDGWYGNLIIYYDSK